MTSQNKIALGEKVTSAVDAATAMTAIQSVKPGRVCKTYTLQDDGSLAKTGAANIVHGVCQTKPVDTAEDLIEILKSASNSDDIALIPGSFIGDDANKFNLTTEAKLAALTGKPVGQVDGGILDIGGKRIAARLKRGILPSQWMLIDADNPEGIPDDWAALGIQGRLQMLEPLVPGISQCERIELRGSSARVHKTGEEPGQATHAWIKVSDASKIEILQAYVDCHMVLQGKSFISPKYSKNDGSLVGQEPRTVIDLVVWTAGRVVFCAKPGVSNAAGYEVADAGITIVNKGAGELDIDWVRPPSKADLDALSKITGFNYSQRLDGNLLIKQVAGQLKPNTPIEVRGVEMPLSHWIEQIGLDGKLRCEAPFRFSSSEAGAIFTHTGSAPCVFDVGNNTTYTMSDEDWATIAGKLMFDEVSENTSLVIDNETGQEIAPGENENRTKTKKQNRSADGPDWDDVIETEKGIKVLPTRPNLEALIDWAGVLIGYDVYNRSLTAEYKGEDISSTIDAVLKDMCVREGLRKETVADYLDDIARRRRVNRPLTWLESLGPSDGDPLAEWLERSGLVDKALGPIQEQWAYVVWKRFFVGACAAADGLERCKNPQAIPKFEQVVVLVSDQGMKKSTVISGLLPKELRHYCGDGINLNLSNKDSYIEATSHWIGELGELDATFRKSDIAALKAFLSRKFDEIRMPYDRRAVKYKRRTIYYGSVNEREFLKDTTGNRRYLPIELTQKMVYSEKLGRGIFAQAWQRYLDGEQWWLTDADERVAKEKSEKFNGNPLIPKLLEVFDFDAESRDVPLPAFKILEALDIKGTAANANKQAIGTGLKALGIEKYGVTAREQRKYYAMPPLSEEYRHLATTIQGWPVVGIKDDFADCSEGEGDAGDWI